MNFLKKLFGTRYSKEAQAVLAASQHIKEYPETYEFMSIYIPSESSDKSEYCACMLGWTGYYLGFQEPCSLDKVARELGFSDANEFYLQWRHSYDLRKPEDAAKILSKLAKKL